MSPVEAPLLSQGSRIDIGSVPESSIEMNCGQFAKLKKNQIENDINALTMNDVITKNITLDLKINIVINVKDTIKIKFKSFEYTDWIGYK